MNKDVRVPSNEYKVIPGATVAKDPTVHVEVGSEKCYVYVAVQNNLVIGANTVASYTPNSDWEEVGKIADKNVTIYKYVKGDGIVDASSARQSLTPVFEEVTFDGENITLGNKDSLDGKTIVIKAYAHQSESLDSTFDVDAAAINHFTTEFGA